MDQLEFFKKTAVYFSMMIESKHALQDLFNYLAGIMPLHALVWYNYDQNDYLVRFQIIVTPHGVRDLPGLTMDLSNSAKQTVYRLKENKFLFIQRSLKDPLTASVVNQLAPYINQNEKSVFLIDLKWLGSYYGHLCIFRNETKPWDSEHIKLLKMLKHPFSFSARHMERHIKLLQLKDQALDENEFLTQELRRITESELIGANSGLRDTMKAVEQLAGVNTPVLIMGETGVGKEMVADAITRSSSRRNKPYLKVNCGAIPETLIDSELFGHEKGAFTSADAPKKGKFERADGGTIFLDEIGDLPLQAQVRLLRVLQNSEFERVGGTKTLSVDTRLITATHRNLVKMLPDGSFREDLFYRINVFPIVIPPLRHRKQDIPILIEYLVKKKVKDMKFSRIPVLADGALDILMKYNWPGNVRELENIVERALIVNPKGPLDFKTLLHTETTGKKYRKNEAEGELLSLDEMNRRYIKRVLGVAKGKINGPDGAAELLNIQPNTLRRRMDKLGIGYGRKYQEYSNRI